MSCGGGRGLVGVGRARANQCPASSLLLLIVLFIVLFQNSIYDLYPPEAQTVYAHASPQGMQPTGQTQHAGSAPVPTDHTGAAGAHMHPGHASAPGSMGQGQPGQDAQADSEVTVAEEMKQLEAVMAQPEVAVPSAFQHARHAQCMLCAAALAALM